MSYHLNIDWHTPAGAPAPAEVTELKAVLEAPNFSAEAQVAGQRLRFAHLEAGFYTLNLSYQYNGQGFNSFYFGLDVPDITSMKLHLTTQGSFIEQMGALNDYGEFMDTRLEEEPVALTHPYKDFIIYKKVADILQDPAFKVSELSLAIGDLGEAFLQLQFLWAHQLRALLSPPKLKQMTPEALACLQHLLSNHLYLMDDESLFEHLQIAIETHDATSQVASLLEHLEWNHEQQLWDGIDIFLAKVSGHGLILKNTPS